MVFASAPRASHSEAATVLLRIRRGRGFALLFSASRLAWAPFSDARAARSGSCLLNGLALLLPVRRLVGDTARLARGCPFRRLPLLLLLLRVLRLIGDTTGLNRSCPFHRLPLLLRMLRLIGDTAELDRRGGTTSTPLKLGFGFSTRSWHPFRSHSWPTGRRGRCDLLARFSPGLPARWPRRR